MKSPMTSVDANSKAEGLLRDVDKPADGGNRLVTKMLGELDELLAEGGATCALKKVDLGLVRGVDGDKRLDHAHGGQRVDHELRG